MISSAILKTLKYSDYFNFPLTLDEIYLRLIGVHLPAQAGPSRALVSRTISDLLKKNLIQKTKSYYHLPGRSDLISRRLSAKKTSAPILSHAKTLTCQFSNLKLPILAIYLTGSLAMSNSDSDDDIDLMIITKSRRLWTTRLLLTLYTTLLGLRRTPNSQKNSKKLCLNLYLTPDSYAIPHNKRTLYTAYELIQAIPLYDPHHTHPALLSANPWINQYLPNVPIPMQKTISSLENCKTGILEHLLYHLQLFYMRSRLTREFITLDSAFFHPHDPGKQALKSLTLYSQE